LALPLRLSLFFNVSVFDNSFLLFFPLFVFIVLFKLFPIGCSVPPFPMDVEFHFLLPSEDPVPLSSGVSESRGPLPLTGVLGSPFTFSVSRGTLMEKSSFWFPEQFLCFHLPHFSPFAGFLSASCAGCLGKCFNRF